MQHGAEIRVAATTLGENAVHTAADVIITELDARVMDEDVPMASDEGDASPGEGGAAAIGEEEANEVPAGSFSNNVTCAGSLSPRGYSGRCSGGEGVHGVMETLHLDQVTFLEQGGQRARGRGV